MQFHLRVSQFASIVILSPVLERSEGAAKYLMKCCHELYPHNAPEESNIRIPHKTNAEA